MVREIGTDDLIHGKQETAALPKTTRQGVVAAKDSAPAGKIKQAKWSRDSLRERWRRDGIKISVQVGTSDVTILNLISVCVWC